MLHVVDEYWFSDLDDDALVAFIEGSGSDPGRRDDLIVALDELFERMRAEAPPEKQAYVEAVIARLAWTLLEEDDDQSEDPGLGGVREPRSPMPGQGGDAVAIRRAAA